MKRDMDLVRSILLIVEDSNEGVVSSRQLATESWDEDTVARHIQLMIEAGLVVGDFSETLDSKASAFIFRLTWAGYDFADTVQSDTVWAKTQASIGSTVGAASFEVVKAVAVGFAMKALGL